MSKPYSLDRRERVIESVAAGASRREAGERLEVSASSAIRWVQRCVQTGSPAAKPSGGSTSPLEEPAQWLFKLIADEPDLTLDEIVVASRAGWRDGSTAMLSVKSLVRDSCLYRAWHGRCRRRAGDNQPRSGPSGCGHPKELREVRAQSPRRPPFT